jgi:hypothetical protein
MAVPKEIREVPRPVNTIVEDSGSDGMYRYAVRSRNGARYRGGNPMPRNGKVIGHIIEGRFVPIKDKTAVAGPDMLSYGSAALFHSVSEDLLQSLLDVYPAKDAYSIIAIACLRVIRPNITCSRLETHYNRTFTSVFYPNCPLSKNTVCDLLQRIGKDGDKRLSYYRKRWNAIEAEHHVAIDGMLKQDNSEVNDLSKFSYKGRVRGTKDISVLYAYDIEKMEPICAEVYPGNSIDAASYKSFIADNDIRKGLLIDDKGFPVKVIRRELADRPDLHYLTPLKRNDKRISDNNLLHFDGALRGTGEDILYSKREMKNGTYLYAFKDIGTASKEEHCFVEHAAGKPFDTEKYLKAKDSFGTIAFESDEDMPPLAAYRGYDDRWLLELVFNRYKNDECLNQTSVQGDFSVIGSEFINFIATTATCRILNKARDAKVLEDETYGDMMEDLSEAWRKVNGPSEPSSDDGYWVHTLKNSFQVMEALGLSKPVPAPPKRKRGRPRKNTSTE